jgi:hypothetical protein
MAVAVAVGEAGTAVTLGENGTTVAVGVVATVATAAGGVRLVVGWSDTVGAASPAVSVLVGVAGACCCATCQTRVPAAKMTNTVTQISTKNSQYWRMIIAPCGVC